jgi:hypothetical protein
MANLFFNLPAPAGNGSGAWVDTSTMGAIKTIVSSAILGTVNVEMTNEAVPANATAVCSFPNGGEITVTLVARWMRVTVTGFRGGGAPNINVGANDDGATFANLDCPSTTGIGVATDTHTLGQLKTVQVAGAFRGSVVIEITEDNVTWQPVMTFLNPGSQTATFAADFMRCRRDAPLVSPGQPIVNLGATDLGGGGSGGAGHLQSFQYTVTGLEPDLAQIVIPLPSARSSSTYVVVCTPNGVTDIVGYDCPKTLYTTTQFQLVLTIAAQAGDVFGFQVHDVVS